MAGVLPQDLRELWLGAVAPLGVFMAAAGLLPMLAAAPRRRGILLGPDGEIIRMGLRMIGGLRGDAGQGERGAEQSARGLCIARNERPYLHRFPAFTREHESVDLPVASGYERCLRPARGAVAGRRRATF